MSERARGIPPKSYSLFNTSLGWCGVVDSPKGVLRIVIGYPKRKQLLTQLFVGLGDSIKNDHVPGDLVDTIKRYFCGERVFFNCVMDWSSLSPFQQKVFKEARKVPYGTVETYGNLARRVGSPNGSRAVGGALARNPFPLVVPCHRIVRGDGQLGGFSAGEGIALKRKLLRLEKIRGYW